MNAPVRVDDLQTALLSRAKALADQYTIRARRDRDLLLREANERLKLRDEREQVAAHALGERAYRQQVQAEELKLRADLDRVRWVQVQAVMDALRSQLETYATDNPGYPELLRRLIVDAARSIESDRLVVQLNSHDYAKLRDGWAAYSKDAVPGKTLELSNEPNERSGGAIVTTDDDSIRVDNTFEGRIARFETALEQVIIERLFAASTPMGALFNG